MAVMCTGKDPNGCLWCISSWNLDAIQVASTHETCQALKIADLKPGSSIDSIYSIVLDLKNFSGPLGSTYYNLAWKVIIVPKPSAKRYYISPADTQDFPLPDWLVS